MKCFFTGTFNVVIIVFLSIISLECNTIPNKQDIQTAHGDKVNPLSTQEKAYSYFCTAYFFLLDRDWENAAENFEKALQFDSSERINRHLATCYFQLGKNDKSIYFIEKLAKIKPEEFSVQYTLATLYEVAGRNQDAIVAYEHARKCKITKLDAVFLADTLYRLANLYMQKGMMEKGAECYKSMFDMKLVTDPAKIYYEIGLKYFEKNDMKKALEYFIMVKQSDPKLNFAGFYLTLCYDALKDYDNAIREAYIFLEQEPDNWVMHLALSEIFEKTKNGLKKDAEMKRAQEILKARVESGSKNPKEYFILGQMYRNQHRIGSAIAVIENLKLIPLDKQENRDAHFFLSNLYYEIEDFDKVEEELLLTLKLDPDFHEANNFLGYLFVENNKNLDEAIQLINKALRAQPENGAYLDSLGWAYYKKAQAEGIDDYFQKALQKLTEAVLFAKEPDIYEHMGEVQYSLGLWDEAIYAFENAEALYKDTFNGAEKIKNLTEKVEKIKRLLLKERTSLRFIGTFQGQYNFY